MSTMNDVTLPNPIAVSGLVPLSTGDFPGQLCAVIFCQGCTLQCRYCHNPHLQPFTGGSMDWSDIAKFLEKRTHLLDAIVFSGGEPTMQPHLEQAIDFCKSLGYKIGLHTAGLHPKGLESILSKIDWVGFDFKATPERYQYLCGTSANANAILDSLALLAGSGVSYEVRTTFHHALIDDKELLQMAELLAVRGVCTFRLQLFSASGCRDDDLVSVVSQLPAEPTLARMRCLFNDFQIRY